MPGTGIAAEVIAIDGKTSRRSYRKKGVDTPIHTVSAFAARQRLVLGRVKVAGKSNEIIAIPFMTTICIGGCSKISSACRPTSA